MDRFNIRPAINIFAGVDGRDLGAVARDVQKAIDASRKDLPRGSVITLRGQVSTMQDSFFGLYVGLVFSMVLVYLLMVVNFQSWSEPFIIITALPVALAGIIWMLFITANNLERAGADGCNHVHGRRDGEQRSGDNLCQRAVRRNAEIPILRPWKLDILVFVRC